MLRLSHDPLLELAIKQSKSGIAMSFDGSTEGLERFNLNQGIASGFAKEQAAERLAILQAENDITAANTAIPTISAIVNSGATPKLVDINNDYLIDTLKRSLSIFELIIS